MKRSVLKWLAAALSGIAAVAMVAGTSSSALAQETPQNVDLTIEEATIDPRTSEVTVTGTVSCKGTSDAFVNVEVRQSVGRTQSVTGYGFTQVPCTGTTAFSLSLGAFEGKFVPGKARIGATAFVCDDFTCYSDDEVVFVQLRSAR